MTARAEAGFGSLEEVADAVAAYLPHRRRPRNLEAPGQPPGPGSNTPGQPRTWRPSPGRSPSVVLRAGPSLTFPTDRFNIRLTTGRYRNKSGFAFRKRDAAVPGSARAVPRRAPLHRA